ncbi:hypothetical protein EBZ39_00880 [bacterium]|nr:hypothetical protein [bacterium]
MKASAGTCNRNPKYFPLEVPADFRYTDSMENKNNRTVKELTDKIAEMCQAKYPTDPSMKWAYTCGILEAMLDWEVKGYSRGIKTLQESINDAYDRYENELQHELELAASRD